MRMLAAIISLERTVDDTRYAAKPQNSQERMASMKPTYLKAFVSRYASPKCV
jgi:hypothetical protein